jgi:hydrogenase maturation protease
MDRKTLVLGLGNTLLGDEGAGVYAVRALQEQYADRTDVEFLDGGTLSFTLAGPIEDADNLIVIDATQLKASPGTVRVFEGEDMDRFLGGNRKSSVHEVSLIDLMAIARLVEALPARRALIGIQPEYLDWSDAPTQTVARAIPVACDLAMQLIGMWRHEQGAEAPRSGDATGRELPPATDSGSLPIAEDSRRWRHELGDVGRT